MAGSIVSLPEEPAREASMSSQQPGVQSLQSAAVAVLHEHWVLFLVEGVVLLVLGATAVVLPAIATLAVTILLGWLFLVSGVIGLFTTYWMRHAPGFWWSLLSAVLAIVVGVMLLASPLTGAFSLTLVLVAFFLVEGAASIMFALDHRRELSGQWGWMLTSGIIDLALAIMIFAGLPSTAAWAVGLLVGISMIFGGVALIAMPLHARTATEAVLGFRFGRFWLGQLGAPIRPVEHERVCGEREQADADHHQGERNRPAEEYEIVAVRHDQRLTQTLLQNRRNHE